MFYGSVGRVGLRALSGGGFSPLSLFASGEQGAWYDPSDLTTLFQDSFGTTPVTAVDQPVGLVLDKRLGLSPGPELVSNGNFSSGTTGWTPTGATLSVDAGRLKIDSTASFGRAAQAIATVVGRSYRLTFSVTNGNASACYIFVGTADDLSAQNYDSGAKANGTHSAIFVATATTTYIKPVIGGSGTFAFYDDISVREIPGNHARQATTSACPVLKLDAQSKYYLQFDGIDDFIEATSFTMPGPYSAWAGVRTGSTNLQCIVNSDDGVAPYMPQYLRINGTFLESIAFSTGGIFTDAGPSVTLTDNFVIAANCSTTSVDATVNGTSNGATNITGTLSSQPRPLTIGRYTAGGFFFNGRLYGAVVRGKASTTDEMNSMQSWMREKAGVVIAPVSFTPASLFTSGAQGMWYDPSDFSTMFQDWQGTIAVTGTGQPVGKILDKSGNGNHLYQSTAGSRPTLEQDGSGKYYLNFDGTNDVMFTGENSGGNLIGKVVQFFERNTRCVTAVSGIRKTSDTGTRNLFSSTQFSLISDSFYMRTSVSGAASYSFQVSGSIDISDATATGYTSPITSVLTGIGFPDNDSIIVRVNGSQVASQTSVDLGNSAFASDVFYVGNQGSALSRWYSGRLYSFVLFGRQATGTELSDTENWVNGKTGAF